MLVDAAFWMLTAVVVVAILFLPWMLTRARRTGDAVGRTRKPFILPPPD